jgi:hypothetical protein
MSVMTNRPCRSVIVLTSNPTTRTLTPDRGALVWESVTVPEIKPVTAPHAELLTTASTSATARKRPRFMLGAIISAAPPADLTYCFPQLAEPLASPEAICANEPLSAPSNALRRD